MDKMEKINKRLVQGRVNEELFFYVKAHSNEAAEEKAHLNSKISNFEQVPINETMKERE
jgi:hypothetical protein